jgi:preprotein translocase subunit SecD
MRRCTCLLATMFFIGLSSGWSQDAKPATPQKLADGVYAVRRDSLQEKEVLPLKESEVLVVHRHRYAKKDQEAPRYLVVGSAPAVKLELAGEPKAVKEGENVVRILLKLGPKAAAALEQLTRDHQGQQIAIVVAGDVVTMHKVREIIKGGEVQITSCAPGAANYLFEQLRASQKVK